MDLAGHWNQASAGEITPLFRGVATLWPTSEQARTGDTTSCAQQAANLPLRQPGSICKQKLVGMGLTANSEQGSEDGWSWRAIFLPVKAAVRLPLPEAGRK